MLKVLTHSWPLLMGVLLLMVGNGIQGMALNLEADNVGVVIFGSDQEIKEGDMVKAGDVTIDGPIRGKLMFIVSPESAS